MHLIKEIIFVFIHYIYAFKYPFKLYKSFLLLLFLTLIFSFPVYVMDYFFQIMTSKIPFFNLMKYEKLMIELMANLSGFFLLIFLSPVFSMVSEKIMHILSGKTYNFSPLQLIRDIIRGIKITFRNFLYEYIYIILITLILWILPENKMIQNAGLLLNTVVVSYFYGFSLLDYALENYRLNYKKSVQFVKKHKGLAIGLGLPYTLTIYLNNQFVNTDLYNHKMIYWTAFGEGFISYIGVIAASILLFKKYAREI